MSDDSLIVLRETAVTIQMIAQIAFQVVCCQFTVWLCEIDRTTVLHTL